MPISPNFTSILSKDWEVNFSQCMPNGYLKYTELCNILQLTAAAHSDVGGISFSDMQEFNQAWVLSRMRVEVSALPKWRDIITVTTWINTLENSRSIRALEVHVNGKKIIGAETFWAVFNTKTRRPENLALPHGHFEKYPQDKATEVSFSKIDTSIAKTFVAEKKILLSDLDIVNHANSVKYLEWCLDYFEPELLLNQSIESFEMNYLKEVSLNETVSIEKSDLQNPTTFTVNANDKICFALQLNLKYKPLP